MTVWASTEYLAAYLGDAVPDNAPALLARASRLVDTLTAHAVYDTDTDGQPTATHVRLAFADATCAQTQAWIDDGRGDYDPGDGIDDQGSETELAELRAAGATSVSFGSLSIGLKQATGTAAAVSSTGEDWATPADETTAVLRRAGLWPARISYA